jgi:hypothetical protein
MHVSHEQDREVTNFTWVKSSHSGTSGGDCLEVAASWTKSSYSGPSGGNCVEVATAPKAMHVRDSKQPDLATLTFPAAHWTALTNSVRHHA